jgi:GNAT superfamily N-acetyltransferase
MCENSTFRATLRRLVIGEASTHGGTVAISILDATFDEMALEAFLAVPKEVYRGDPDYCAPFRSAVMAAVGQDAFAGNQKLFVAVEGDRPVARVVARRSPALVDGEGRPYGILGFFESLDHPAAVDRLFAEAVGWLRGLGAGPIVGPMDGDTWHRYRLNVGPHEARPFLMEPYNPAHYADHWERNGFKVLERYYSKGVDDVPGVLPRLEGKYREVVGAGYRLQRLHMERFESELERFYALSVEVFRNNFLYSDISLKRFLGLYSGARGLVDPELVRFAVAPDGSDAGFLFAFPDRFRAVASMKGSRNPVALVRFVALKRRADAVNLKSLGVVRAHRRSGLASALMYSGYRAALERGYRRVNLCLILDGNPSGDLDGGLGTTFRRYHLYQLAEGRRS